MFGILNINKPAGVTSRDIVNIVQRVIRPMKTGHAGTLDPIATGVLLVPVGRATRLTEYIHKASKTYVARFELGKTSDTEDSEGLVTPYAVAAEPTSEQVQNVVDGFQGKQWQQPPVYSALRVNGKRAYQLAREGKPVELKRREIEVFHIQVLSFSYPQLTVEVNCSSGTYIRSLGRDIGERLQTGAIMTKLARTAIGDLQLQHAVAPEFSSPADVEAALVNPLRALAGFEQLVLTDLQQQELMHGRRITVSAVVDSLVLGVSSDDELLTVLQRVDESDHFKPIKNFFPS